MAAKRSLNEALRTKHPARPKGEGLKLSTQTGAETKAQDVSAQEHNGTTAPKVLWPSKGQHIRTDLLKEIKRIAFEDDRKDYEVIEDALEQYFARWKESKQQ